MTYDQLPRTQPKGIKDTDGRQNFAWKLRGPLILGCSSSTQRKSLSTVRGNRKRCFEIQKANKSTLYMNEPSNQSHVPIAFHEPSSLWSTLPQSKMRWFLMRCTLHCRPRDAHKMWLCLFEFGQPCVHRVSTLNFLGRARGGHLSLGHFPIVTRTLCFDI